MLEKLQNLKTREKLGLCLAGLFCAFLLMDRFAIQPVADTLDGFDRSIASEEKEIAYRRSVIEQGPLVSEEYRKSSERIDEIKSESDVIDRMRASIDDLARESGLMISAREPREPVVSTFHETFAFEIGSFDSTLTDLVQFLYKIDTMPGLLRVTRLTLDTDTPRGHVSGSILITKVAIRVGNAG